MRVLSVGKSIEVAVKWFPLLMTLSCDIFIIISSFNLSFLIIKTNAKQQIKEYTRCRHAVREKPHSRGKPSQNSSFSRSKMRRPRPLQVRLKTTFIKSSFLLLVTVLSPNSCHCVCTKTSLLWFHQELVTVMPTRFYHCNITWDFLIVIALRPSHCGNRTLLFLVTPNPHHCNYIKTVIALWLWYGSTETVVDWTSICIP